MDTATPFARAHQLLLDSRYLCLATAGRQQPWVAPVQYAISAAGELLFCSPPQTRHAKDLQAHDEVAVAIYHALSQDIVSGLQLLGHCRPSTPENLSEKWRDFYTEAFPDPSVRQNWEVPLEDFGADRKRMIYAITIDECWLFDTRPTSEEQGRPNQRRPVDARALVHSLVEYRAGQCERS